MKRIEERIESWTKEKDFNITISIGIENYDFDPPKEITVNSEALSDNTVHLIMNDIEKYLVENHGY